MLKQAVKFLIRNKSTTIALRCFHPEFSKPEVQIPAKNQIKNEEQNAEELESDVKTSIPAAVQNKYKIFRDEDATEIFDVEEERQRYQIQDAPDADINNEYGGLNTERGFRGVFDIEDLVDVLRKEHVDDVFVCAVPKELKYVDYIVTCSGRSYRHMLATAEFVRRMFKVKRDRSDIIPKIEGAKSRDWMALDLGNIALHIFSPEAREEYDLESLWSIGSQYDRESNKPLNPYGDLLKPAPELLEEIKRKV